MTPAETPNKWIHSPGGSISIKSQHSAHKSEQLWAGKCCKFRWESFAHNLIHFEWADAIFKMTPTNNMIPTTDLS